MAATQDARTVRDLAQELGAECIGDPDRTIRGVRPLALAGPEDLSFLANPKYAGAARVSEAGALLVRAQDAESLSAERRERAPTLLVVPDPQESLAQVLEVLFPPTRQVAGVHPTAHVGEGVVFGSEVVIGPYCVVGDRSELGDGVVLHAHAVVGEDCSIGAGSELFPHVVVYAQSILGERNTLHAGAVVGADGFGYASNTGLPTKMRQVGRVVLGNDVEVGANSTIDRATLEETRIGDGTKIDNLVQVGHNVEIGSGCLLCGQAGVAGSTKLGDHVVLAGQVGVSGHLEVGDGVQVAAKSAVLQSTESGAVGGIPAMPIRDWQRQAAALRRLSELRRRVRELEKTVERAASSTDG